MIPTACSVEKKPFHGHSSFGGACPVASSVCQKTDFFSFKKKEPAAN